MNAAQVNARIEELMEQHDRWWAAPEAMAEAMKLWGTGANEHGVFCTHERIEIAKTPHGHAAVLIAESGNPRNEEKNGERPAPIRPPSGHDRLGILEVEREQSRQGRPEGEGRMSDPGTILYPEK